MGNGVVAAIENDYTHAWRKDISTMLDDVVMHRNLLGQPLLGRDVGSADLYASRSQIMKMAMFNARASTLFPEPDGIISRMGNIAIRNSISWAKSSITVAGMETAACGSVYPCGGVR